MIVERFLLVFALYIAVTTGSALHEPCETDEDCGTIDTLCHKRICSCKENFTVWYDSCVPLAHPTIHCTKRHECQQGLGVKSMCTKKKQCACKPFHHLHLGQCVKNRDLHDTCEHDHQCYCGADCDAKIACIRQNCTCKPGHRPYKSRRCISEIPIVLSVSEQQIQDDPIEEQDHIEEPKEKKSTSGSCSSKAVLSALIVTTICFLIK